MTLGPQKEGLTFVCKLAWRARSNLPFKERHDVVLTQNTEAVSMEVLGNCMFRTSLLTLLHSNGACITSSFCGGQATPGTFVLPAAGWHLPCRVSAGPVTLTVVLYFGKCHPQHLLHLSLLGDPECTAPNWRVSELLLQTALPSTQQSRGDCSCELPSCLGRPPILAGSFAPHSSDESTSQPKLYLSECHVYTDPSCHL